MPKTSRELDKRWRNAKKAWMEEDLEFLDQKYGLTSLNYICRRLQRSPHAIKVAATRRLRHGMKANFYTANQVAELLLRTKGASKTIVFWMEQGWLNGRRSYARAGPNIAWCFFEGDILKCLRARPWLCDPMKMERHYFHSVIQEEYERDPWYTCDEVAPMLGVKTHDAVQRYIRRGLLTAVKRPGGPWQWRWIIRRSDIQKFLADDPRPSRNELSSVIRLKKRYEKGLPVRLSAHWSVLCRLCGQRVLVMAAPGLKGPQVQALFQRIYTNSTCTHGLKCSVGIKTINVKGVHRA